MTSQTDTMTTSANAATPQTSEAIASRITELRGVCDQIRDESRERGNVCSSCGEPHTEHPITTTGKVYFSPQCDCLDVIDRKIEDLVADHASCLIRERKLVEARAKIEANNPGRFSDASIDTWPAKDDQPTALKAINAFMKLVLGGEAKALVMMGGVGCGKTHLAYGAANDLIKLGRDVKVIKVGNWIRQINMSYSSGADIEKTLIEPVFDAEVLVLDDLGKESTTDATRRVLYELLDHRWQQRLPTIVTTNFEGPKQLTEHYSDDAVMQGAISSRLLGLAGKFVVQMKSQKDHRWQ